ncbi:hypothetical protein BDZ94DRAFT_1262272 [Collybia nuda]|uniref:Uncharacterized protein n=1 Tax=Collybia nuda TaxID=64659 RepID=A0A9P5Y4E0_9AGAR|nr:hypothetical protein BDZ94DRAFT_1262272 [Collybia nuda]
MISYTIISGIGLGKLGQLPQIGRDAFAVYQWFVFSLGLTLTTHVLLTSLIVGKIWKGARNSTIYIGTTRHMAVVWMVFESGAVYSVAVALLVVFAALKTQAAGISAHVFIQLCELVPTLIIVRVGLGLTSDLTTHNHDTMIRFHHPLDLSVHQMTILGGYCREGDTERQMR